MPTPARVVVMPGTPGPLQVQDVKLPDPGPYQVVVKQYASGICHSQLHQMHGPRSGNPGVLGHESTGVVIAKGKEVTHVKEGDMVFVTWVPRDVANATRQAEASTVTLADGSVAAGQAAFTWADHTIADEQYVVKVPADTTRDVTAIIGCAVMTGSGAVYHTAGVKKGESVAIFGVGGVGLSAIAAAAVVGADPIIAVDLDDAKLDFAKRFGATIGVNAREVDPIAKIRELTASKTDFTIMGTQVAGVDYAFDCIGFKVTMEQILPAVRDGAFGKSHGGTAVLVGVPGTPVELNAMDMLLNEKKYIGSLGGSCVPDRDFPMFLRWYKEGDLDLNALVTARYSIDQINEATDALEHGKISGRAILEF
ncbi:MAG: zinc-binding dehydrogenase [Dehalococcoidia bacterium]|nr:zinc-binding dehydrogenase [Dehalococcoidia bacterium]